MSENVEAKAIESEELSIQEKEEALQEQAGTVFEDGMYKVDLNQPPAAEQNKEEENAVQEQEAEGSVLRGDEPAEEAGEKAEVELQEVRQEEEVKEETEQTVLEELPAQEEQEETIKEVEDLAEKVEEAFQKEEEQGIELPENIQKVVDFINETGGSLEDYVALNKDYSNVDDLALLREYYQQSKPHLSSEEIDFLIEDKFTFDEEVDDERDVKRKKLAFKEEVASAKSELEGLKTKYYEEIKAGSRLTQDQQKAVDFFNRYNTENEESSKIAEKAKSVFLQKTDQVFNDEFKGFEYKVGDKRYRFNVKDTDEVKTTQSDINNFIRKFLNEDQVMSDAKGYHKSLFTAMNADAIANHFYQQGKSDAMKESMKTAKNINMDPRGVHTKNTQSGMQAKVLAGDDTSKLKLKLKNY
jgi:hypothetical protein